jgi:hypothetical protein
MNQRQIAAIVRMKKSGYRVVAIARYYGISVKNVTNGVY